MAFGDTMTWIAPDGTSTLLTENASTFVEWGRKGFGMPPFRHLEDHLPLAHESRVRAVWADPRVVDIPLLLKGADQITLRTQLRRLCSTVAPPKGTGTLRIRTADGSERDLACRYAGGLEVDESEGQSGPGWLRAVLTFRAADPFWYDRLWTTLVFSNLAPINFFPILPLHLAPSSVLGLVDVTNDGDAEAWPVWTLTGALATLVATNAVTGAQLALTLNPPLITGETLTIDTRPGAKTVTRQNGANLFGSLWPTSELWSLQPGLNTINLQTTGADSTTSVRLQYRRRFWAS